MICPVATILRFRTPLAFSNSCLLCHKTPLTARKPPSIDMSYQTLGATPSGKYPRTFADLPLSGKRNSMLRNWALLAMLAFASFGMLLFAEEGGFSSLFDGNSLEGWEQKANLFRVVGKKESAAIVAGNLDSDIANNEFLCTTKDFGDFELRLEAKLEGDGQNAGIQFRSQRKPNHYEVIGYQCDAGMMNAKSIWGALYDEERRKKFLVHDEAACEKALKATAEKNGWNQIVIRCVGPRIQIWVNGVQTTDYTETDDGIPRSGKIGLQIHGGKPVVVAYRQVRIKELSAEAAK